MNVPQPEDPTVVATRLVGSAAAAAVGLFIGTRVIVYGARGVAAFGGPVGVAALGAGGAMWLIHQGKFHYAATVGLVPLAAMLYLSNRDSEQARERGQGGDNSTDEYHTASQLGFHRRNPHQEAAARGAVQPASPNLGSTPAGGRNHGPAMGLVPGAR